MLLLGLERSSSGPQWTRQQWWVWAWRQAREGSSLGFNCSQAPRQPRRDTLALQSHNQNNWEEQDGGKMGKKGMNIFDGRQPCLKERTGACIHQAGSLRLGLRYTTTSLQCDSRVNTHNTAHVLPQCMWASAVRLFLDFSCFSLILLTFRRQQRSPERLQPKTETVNAALASVPPLNEQHRTVEDLKAIVAGWRIKRAMKLKCFRGDDVRLQGHCSG